MQPASTASRLDTFWALGQDEVFQILSCNKNGLSGEDASNRLKQYGANRIKAKSKSSAFILFLLQFKSPITLLLIAAALLSMGLGDFTDAIIILVIIFISSALGFWQEKGAANAINELLKMVQIKCRLLRDGTETELPVETTVPGDIIFLSAGDVIPGDSLLLESKELFIDEAAFTGETFPVEKNVAIVPSSSPLAKRSNAVFMGSHVISGRAIALVIKTGKKTEFGKISDQLRSRAAETDFEKGIRRFGYMLMEITLLLVLIIFATNILLHKPPLDSFLFSLALAVGLTPQLLPAIITVNLSVGARSMARQQVIVKRLSSIENFGSMNILCSDKTGTITEGKVTLKDTLDIEGNHSDKTIRFAWLNASLQQGFHNPIDEAICSKYQGNSHEYSVQCEIPYDFIRKRLTIQVKNDHENFAVTKGALNSILQICDTAEKADGQTVPLADNLEKIKLQYQQLSAAGFRVLGVAYKKASKEKDFTRTDEKDMTFLGFITLFDPPKKNAAQTIANLRNLGVQLKLITGDNALVAESLAKQIGMESPVILTGQQLRQMSEAALTQQAFKTDIFAEVEPNQKERIIISLKKSGHVVGFMGDGINDAPALHTADVGISVDSAVDVAKEAADIVLLNQDLKVLSAGIVAGRKTFANTMKYIFMATSANFGNMFSMAGASLFLPFLPLLPKQILLTNLLTDFPEMTIATDRVDSISVEKPHRWDIKFIQRFMIVFGLLSSIFDYLTFAVLILIMNANESQFQTGWFIESVISASFIVLVMRTRLPFFKSLPGKYLSIATVLIAVFVLVLPLMPFASLLGFVRLPYSFYLWMIAIVVCYILSAEIAKRWFYNRAYNKN
ncbi:MAG: magnesium-translocating P-type ATPase [Bacteroidetes bacterium]|nr:magnesium-translocating P-type ATPase [Bacteroidota bacterium]